MPQCTASKRHEYLADSSALYLVSCRHCGVTRRYKPRRGKKKNGGAPDVQKYLRYRRSKRRVLGLLNVAAPLDFCSARDMLGLAEECGVRSNTAMPHLTYAEGLNPDAIGEGGGGLSGAIEGLRTALWSNPEIKVTKVHSVPRRGGALPTDLILADVEVHPSVGDAAGALCRTDRPEWCLLPQFPLHVALGACVRSEVPSVLEQLRKTLVGRMCGVDAGRMKILAPVERPGGTENDTNEEECEEEDEDLAVDLSFLEDGGPPADASAYSEGVAAQGNYHGSSWSTSAVSGTTFGPPPTYGGLHLSHGYHHSVSSHLPSTAYYPPQGRRYYYPNGAANAAQLQPVEY